MCLSSPLSSRRKSVRVYALAMMRVRQQHPPKIGASIATEMLVSVARPDKQLTLLPIFCWIAATGGP